MIEVTRLPLTEEQIEVLSHLRVPLYHEYKTDQRFIANRYWLSIKPNIQQAILRILGSREACQ